MEREEGKTKRGMRREGKRSEEGGKRKRA